MRALDRIRAWIDAKDHRPVTVAITIVEIPVFAALWGVCIGVHAPWWTVPVIIGGFLLAVGWVLLVVSALTRWFR